MSVVIQICPEHTRGGQKASWMPWLEGGLLAVAAPVLLFPSRWPLVTAGVLVALALVWLLCGLIERHPWPITPFNSALLVFSVMVGVGIIVTPIPDLTLPKATGLILGLAVFRFTGLWANSRQRLIMMLITYCLVGMGILVVGLLGTDWRTKIPALDNLLARLPRLITQLPEAPDAGISPNQLAGVLILYLPLVTLGIFGWYPRGRRVWLWLLALAGLLLLLGVLILTQSRGGWLGGLAGLVVLVALVGLITTRRWVRWSTLAILIAVGGALIGGIWLMGGLQEAGAALHGQGVQSALEETVGPISIEGRVEIWSRALYAIADFPFTGCGLGTFRQVVWLLYPLFVTPSGHDIAHAHNIFLQTALDLGLPGLVAYLAFLGVAGAVSWQVIRRSDLFARRIAMGLAAGLVGLHIYGLTDVVALGSKPGLAFWMALGLIAVLPTTLPPADCPTIETSDDRLASGAL